MERTGAALSPALSRVSEPTKERRQHTRSVRLDGDPSVSDDRLTRCDQTRDETASRR